MASTAVRANRVRIVRRGGPQQVSEGHTPKAAARKRQAADGRGKPSAPRGQVPGPDSVHGLDPDRPEYGPQHRYYRQDEPDGRGAGEDARLERRDEDGQRDEALEHALKEAGDQQPDAYSEHHAQHGYLDSHEQGPHGYGEGVRAEGHGRADLAALGLYHPGGEVQRGERRAREQHQREYVVELLVPLGVAGEGEVRSIVLRAHEIEAGLGVAGRRLGQQHRLHAVHVCAGLDCEHQVIDQTLPARQSLGGLQGREQHGQVRLSEEAALLDDQEVLGRHGVAYVSGGDAAPDLQLALVRQPVVDAEVALDQDDRLPDLPLFDRPPHQGLHAVDAGTAARHVDADDPAANEKRAIVGGDLDLGLEDEPLLDCRHAFDALRDGPHGALREEAVAAGPRADVVHVRQREARVVGGEAPLGDAAQPGVHAGADGDHQGDARHLDPACPGVPERPAQPQRQHANSHQLCGSSNLR